MSKMSDLSMCISEMRSAAASLISAADSLALLFSGDEPVEEQAKQPEAPAPKPITLEDVRGVMADKSAKGHGKAVKALLRKYQAAKLSDVDPSDYADLLLEAQAIGAEVAPDA